VCRSVSRTRRENKSHPVTHARSRQKRWNLACKSKEKPQTLKRAICSQNHVKASRRHNVEEPTTRRPRPCLHGGRPPHAVLAPGIARLSRSGLAAKSARFSPMRYVGADAVGEPWGDQGGVSCGARVRTSCVMRFANLLRLRRPKGQVAKMSLCHEPTRVAPLLLGAAKAWV
jgi:hypothetical protein